jgi:hypothetical protein
MPTYREDPAAYQRARYHRLRAAGLCTVCQYPTRFVHCEWCAAEHAKRYRKTGRRARPDRRLYP